MPPQFSTFHGLYWSLKLCFLLRESYVSNVIVLIHQQCPSLQALCINLPQRSFHCCSCSGRIISLLQTFAQNFGGLVQPPAAPAAPVPAAAAAQTPSSSTAPPAVDSTTQNIMNVLQQIAAQQTAPAAAPQNLQLLLLRLRLLFLKHRLLSLFQSHKLNHCLSSSRCPNSSSNSNHHRSWI